MKRTCAACGKPADFNCGGCKLVSYCSKDHQRQDWKAGHKSACKPLFKMEVNETLGRHLVATRTIRRGELIFQEPPLVLGPKSVSARVCLGCHSSCDGPKARDCDGCGYPLCSVQCQVSDAHFDECQVMMKKKFRAKIEDDTPNHALYFPIVPLRIVLLKEKHPERFKKIMEMQSHVEERKSTQLYAVYKQNVVAFLQQRLGLAQAADEDTILHITGVLDTNAFEIRTKGSKLRGLYAIASLLAHDCTANTRHTFHGPEHAIAVSATVDIPQGTPITATYTQTFWGTIARRTHLRAVKCFSCSCKRCSDPTEMGTYFGAFRCSRCADRNNYEDGPKMVSTKPLDDNAPWRCFKCGHEIAAKLVRSGNENLKEEVARLDKSTPAALEEFLAKYGVESVGILHPRNTFVIQVKHALVQMYGNKPGLLYSDLPKETIQRKIDYCHDLMDVVDIVDPGYSRIRGQILGELQAAMVMYTKTQFEDGKVTRQFVQETLAESMAILGEAIDIMRNEPDADDLRERLLLLSKELDE